MPDDKNTTKSFIQVVIQLNNSNIITIDCNFSFYGQYVTSSHSLFLEALSRTEGWFTVDGLDGAFYAIPVSSIQGIRAEVKTSE
jgi:hypothetical protein